MLGAGFLVWLNGPGFRWALGTLVPRYLADKQGIEGGIGRVSGSLLGGPTLEDVSLEGASGAGSIARRVKADRIEVRYRLLDFLGGSPLKAIDSVELAGVDAEINLPPSGDRGDEANAPKGEAPFPGDGEWREIVWQALGVRLLLDDVTVRVHRGDQTWGVEHLTLRLPGLGDGEVRLAKVELPDGSERGAFSARTSATEEVFALRDLEVVDEVVVEEVSLLRAGEPLARSRIRAFGAALDVAFRSDRIVRLALAEGRFDLGAALRAFDVPGPESAGISELLAEVTLGDGFPATWSWSLDAAADNIRHAQAELSSLRLHAVSVDGRIEAEARAVPASGSIVLAADTDWSSVGDGDGVAKRPINGTLVIEVPEIARLVPQQELANRIAGGIEGNVGFQLVEFRPVGLDGQIQSISLAYDDVAIDSIEGRFSGDSVDQIGFEITVALDAENSVKASGAIRPDGLAYEGSGSAMLAANPRLSDLARKLGATEAVTGSIALDWKGTGSVSENHHEGEAALAVRQGRYGDAVPAADLDSKIRYAPGSASLDDFEFDFGTFAGRADVRWKDARLDLEGLHVRADDVEVVTARASLPLAMEAAKAGIDGLLAQDGPLDVELKVPPITMQRVGALLGNPLPIEATADVDLAVKGTLQNPTGGGSLRVSGFRIPAAEKIQPADAKLDLTFADGSAAIAGVIRHPDIEPIELRARTGFRPNAWATGGFDAAREQFSASLRMPPSRLAFVAEYLPALGAIDGSASIDLQADGAVNNPNLAGTMTIDAPSIRPASPTVPPARDVRCRLVFSGRTLTVEQLEAIVNGGRIALGGSVDASTDLRNPVFDLKIAASEALVARTNELNLRCDADLTIAGAWRAAAVKGVIGLRGGRFAKTIDLIPAKLGSGTSKLPEVERPEQVARSRIELGTDLVPFKDWTVDLVVRSVDPFLVRTNLGRADIFADITIGGTGAMLVPGGTIRADDGVAVLPFSDITLTKAELRFSERTLFNPALSVDGRAEVGDYLISLFGYGTVTQPKMVLTSSPPLPQEDIISLLSTGATTSTLAGGNGAVALSRAAMLLLDDLTGRGQRGAEDALRRTLRTKVRIEPGQVDQRTGDTMVGGRVDLWKGFSFVGSMGLEGHYRALFRYVFRFR